MRNIKITVEYDGTAYSGWQRQEGAGTIQEALENVAGRIMQETIRIVASGRTDAGVHALGQTASFRTSTALPVERIQAGMNSLLSPDIAITAIEEVPASFHARYDSASKVYQYFLYNAPVRSPLRRRYCWHVREPLDCEAMGLAAASLRGRHDFSAFRSSGSDVKTTERTVFATSLLRSADNMVIFEIEGDGFLRSMVRSIMGTLVDVGKGKITPETFRSIMESGDRNRAGATAPPQGLFLKEVRYR
ncbi:MAG: hypothetical protein AVO39_07000 [delta proteobacterium MLS_D]|jgi:tRNA pseudouridine38-40 synthase|nr:MAG: hypothetical protein AVO39_07000 [delta proteobacterium MLS_D]